MDVYGDYKKATHILLRIGTQYYSEPKFTYNPYTFKNYKPWSTLSRAKLFTLDELNIFYRIIKQVNDAVDIICIKLPRYLSGLNHETLDLSSYNVIPKEKTMTNVDKDVLYQEIYDYLYPPKQVQYKDILPGDEYEDHKYQYESIYEYYHVDNLVCDDIYLSEHDIKYINPTMLPQPGLRVKNDIEIETQFGLKTGQIIKQAKPYMNITFTNKIVKEFITTKTPNWDTLLSPNSNITLRDFVLDTLKTQLYNIKIKQLQYNLKWSSNDITQLNIINGTRLKYATPYEQHTSAIIKYSKPVYGIHIDVTTSHNRLIKSSILDILQIIVKNSPIEMVCSIEFNQRIVIKIEPFNNQTVKDVYLYGCKNQIIASENITKKEFIHVYNEWKNKYKDYIRALKWEELAPISTWWTEDDTEISQHIQIPRENNKIIYVGYHSLSNHIKIGRTVDWESRFSLYTKLKPPHDSINPIMTLRYYLYTPTHYDSIIERYIMYCAEDFLKTISDNSGYVTRVISNKERKTEYYTLDGDMNEYLDYVVNRYMNLTLKELVSYRSNKNKKKFIRKIEEISNEQMFDEDMFNQLLDELDDTIKLKDYNDQTFTPELKDG